MARKIVIIQVHPDPGGWHLCRGLADAYASGAEAAGHAVRRIEIASLNFPILRTQEDFESGHIPPGLDAAAADIAWADHLVIVFPLWLGTQPALLKAFLEQVARPGVAFEYVKDGFPRQLWKGKSARVVITMGMPALVYRWWFGAHGLRALERNILKFAGIKPVRESLFGGVGQASDIKRQEWLDTMRRYGGSGD